VSAYSPTGLLTATATMSAPVMCPGASWVVVTVANAAVLVQLGDGGPTPLWRDSAFKTPGVWTMPGPVDAVRFQAAAAIDPLKPPRVQIEAY
jgi:hypothetical protein